MSYTPNPILVGVVLIIIACIIALFVFKSSKMIPKTDKSTPTCLFLGLPGSGKTSLISALRDGKAAETISSMIVSSTFIQVSQGTPKQSKSFCLVDIPGNKSFAREYQNHLLHLRFLFFVVDSSHPNYVRLATYIHRVLTDVDIMKLGKDLKVVFVCHKSDLPGASSSELILKQILNHLTSLDNHIANSIGLGTTTTETENLVTLTPPNVDVTISQLPFTVSVIRTNTSNMKPLISELYPPIPGKSKIKAD